MKELFIMKDKTHTIMRVAWGNKNTLVVLKISILILIFSIISCVNKLLFIY